MRKWDAIKREDAADTLDGAHYVQNARYYLEGEIQRRRGLVKFAAVTSPRVMTNFWTPTAGFKALFFTSAGTIEGLTAS